MKIHGSILIARPVEIVFDTVADQRNEPLYNPDMTECRKITDGPIGVGTRFESAITTRGRLMEMATAYTAFDRPRLLASVTDTPTGDVTGSLTFAPEGTGTRMGWEWHLHLVGSARLLAPLMPLLGPRMERKIWTGLKEHLERTP